jgi:hypothetical protein
LAVYVCDVCGWQAHVEAEICRTGERQHVEIYCRGEPLPTCMDIGTVQRFLWKSADDMELTFRIVG